MAQQIKMVVKGIVLSVGDALIALVSFSASVKRALKEMATIVKVKDVTCYSFSSFNAHNQKVVFSSSNATTCCVAFYLSRQKTQNILGVKIP